MNKIIAVLFWFCLISKIHRLKASDNDILCACVYVNYNFFKCILNGLHFSQSFDETNFENICGDNFRKNNFDNGYREIVYQLELINFTLNAFPGVLLNKFYRLTALTIKNAGMQSFDSHQFENGSDYLTTLDLSFNKIKALQKNQFEHLLNIESIDLSHNMIEVIDDDAFPTRNYIYFTIDLSFNRIKFFKQEWLLKLNNAIFAILAHNEIAEVELNNLTQNFNFAFNKINIISCKKEVNQITTLDLSHNQLFKTEFFYECMSKLINLNTLDLSANSLGTQPYLNVETFAQISNLEVLSLAGNNFSFIPYGLFSFQKKLKKLDLSHNQFQNSFEPKSLISLRSLNTLDLSFSGIRSVYELLETGKVLKSLTFLGFEGNEFSCKCLGHFILQLEKQRRIQIIKLKKIIIKNSNIDGIICYDEIRNENYCNQN